MRHSSGIDSFSLAAALETAATSEGSELTFAELARAYCAAHMDESDLRLRKWVDAFGLLSAWSITTEQLEAAGQAMHRHGYKGSTINRDFGTVGSLYRWAKKRRLAPRGFKSPTLGMQRFEEEIRRVHIEAADLERIRTVALAYPDRRFGVFVNLAIETGARKSELLERCWKDVDLDAREILAPTTKNGTPRVLFFSERTEQLIRRVCVKRAAHELVFPGRVPGLPIDYKRAWSALTAQINLPTLHLHDLRHAAAANMLRAGVTLAVAAQVLGHDPAVLARRYGHLETEALRKAQEASWRANCIH
ncbi:MAG TPA: site-specific integrase [Ramlibacter sp.]